MKRSLILFVVIVLLLAACAPAAAPATSAPAAQQPAAPQPTAAVRPPEAPAAAQPTQARIPTQVPAQPAPPTALPQATNLPEIRPPQSGGVLNPPTIIPTAAGDTSVIAGQDTTRQWLTFRDSTTGLIFQYPSDWQQASSRNNKSTALSVIVARADQPITNSSSILIDVRKKQGDLLPWLSRQLPTGLLFIDAKALEGGADSYKTNNALLAGIPAVFIYSPAHGKSADVAELHTTNNQYFYQFTYLGGTPDNVDDRAVFLHLLNTASISGTALSGVGLPPKTTFTNGVDTTKWK